MVYADLLSPRYQTLLITLLHPVIQAATHPTTAALHIVIHRMTMAQVRAHATIVQAPVPVHSTKLFTLLTSSDKITSYLSTTLRFICSQ
jgi:hypothetical protein